MSKHARETQALNEFTTQEYGRYAFIAREIRTHRQPTTLPIHKLLALFTLLTIGATVLNVSTVDAPPVHTPAVAAPSTVHKPLHTLDTDAGTIVPAGNARDFSRVSRSQARKPPQATVPTSHTPTGKYKPAPAKPAVSKVERVLSYALTQQGDAYSWGASGPNAFDCSGLVMAAYKQIGISLPHFTGGMLNLGKRISRTAMVRGDLIFPTSGHVGLYLGNNKMIVASSGHGKVMVQSISSFYTARRIL